MTQIVLTHDVPFAENIADVLLEVEANLHDKWME